MFCSCDKMPANGDLDGMWQIVEIERDGNTQNVQADRIYMSIQLKLFMLGEQNNPNKCYGYFEHVGDKIRFWKFSYDSAHESEADDNLPVEEENIQFIKLWGFYTLDETFNVEHLTKNDMTLRSDSVRIRYIKF